MRTLTRMMVLLLAAGAAYAQDSRGQIIGRVSDAAGAAIPGVEVKVTNVATNVTLTGSTNEQGNYEVPYLPPGVYTVRVAVNGFKSYTRDNLAVPAQYLSASPVRDQITIAFLTAQVNNPFASFAPGTTLGARTVVRQQLLRPFPQFLDITVDEPIGYSWYHELQTRVERRFSQGFTLTGTWTWSKFMEATSFLNPTDPLPHEVISDLDRPHRFTATGIYELPFRRGRKWFGNAPGIVDGIIGGWQAQGVWQFNTGAPLGFGNAILLGDIRDVALSRDERTYDRWFDDSLFERDAARQLANNIRTLPLRFGGIRGPELNVWNLSALKKFRIAEGVHLQFRGEFLNAFNRSGLGAPNTAPANTLFGRVTTTNGFPRQIHFGLKLTF